MDNKDIEWDHERFKNWIRKAIKEEYHNFLKEPKKLKINNNKKEFYLKMRFWSEIDRNTGLLTELAERNDGAKEATVITDRNEINRRIVQKYKALCRDNGAKQIYLNSFEDVLIEFTNEDLDFALKRLSFKKATGWDFIQGMVFNLIKDETKHNP